MDKIKAKDPDPVPVPLHGDGVWVDNAYMHGGVKRIGNGPNGSLDGKSKLQAQPNYTKALTGHNSRKWASTNP
ncbi:hypothetical protein PRUPE_2G287600 [Prunus persica]|uniref:Uncharacterized protein n=1 Tax=Prunus persica TaxID=3760 RepID=M5XJM5_PRUPE|nr:hypothetical protein PRUPE_2G287600 [Prunus persica]